MLKPVKIALSGIILSASTLASAQTDINEALQNICSVVQADDKMTLRKKISRVQKQFNLGLKDYYSSISCNGNSLIRTAFKANAVDTGTLLMKRLPKSKLTAPEEDGKTLTNWVVENNFTSSPLHSVLKTRS